ncbi:MAG: peptidase S1 [Brevundimonas sp.]
MRIHFAALAAISAIALAAGSAAAQDTGASPVSGSYTLNAGFEPDPYRISVTPGGSINAQDEVSSSCRGYISNAADVELTYRAGNWPLTIEVASNSDTTLVINGPDGRWYCDDDSGDGSNPRVHFNNPQGGVYDIWVGTYGGGLASGTLIITELE